MVSCNQVIDTQDKCNGRMFPGTYVKPTCMDLNRYLRRFTLVNSKSLKPYIEFLSLMSTVVSTTAVAFRVMTPHEAAISG